MQQIKVFVGLEDATAELEERVNSWIADNDINVVSITGNIAPQSILPTKQAESGGLGGNATTRRFAPSDLMVLVTYEKG